MPAIRSLAPSAGLAIAIALSAPQLALADAIPEAGGGSPIVTDPLGRLDPFVLTQLGFLALVALAAIAAWRRPAWRRPIAAATMGLVLGAVGLFLIVAGLFFADWSGGHRVSEPAVIVGSVLASAAIVSSIRILRDGSS